jgi:5-deoxy-glucuronate isomerase
MRELPAEWKYQSPDEEGFHLVISPDNSPCKATWVFRLNLKKGASFELVHPDLELNAGVMKGSVSLTGGVGAGGVDSGLRLSKLDSFYAPGGQSVTVLAHDDAVLYIGGGPWEGEGSFFVRLFDPALPIGDVHQIHGEPPFEREVFMTLDQYTPASRMINGFTWGAAGAWTSWPPHQHSRELEEVYCYYDIEPPHYAFHLASRRQGEIEAVHPVSSGDFVVVPEGYHPTVAMPGVRSSYFWVMVAHERSFRRYDLAKADFGV